MKVRTIAAVALVAVTATGCVRFTAPDSPPPLTTATARVATSDNNRIPVLLKARNCPAV